MQHLLEELSSGVSTKHSQKNVETVRYLEKGTIECGNVGFKYLLELNICGHHSNIHI